MAENLALLMKMKTEYIQVRVSEDFKKRLQEAAAAQNRTVSNFIIAALEKEMRRKDSE